MTPANIMRFFAETHQCGPGAKGIWRPGGDLFAEFAEWHGDELFPEARMSFYAHMRALGFAQQNRERVYFFVPRKAGEDL